MTKIEINYIKGVIKEQDSNESIIELEKSQLVDIQKKEIELERRNFGNFEDKAFYLPSFFDWIIVKDDKGGLCLVPVRKEGEKSCS